jgi:tetratricopeptide (TPR) repeat protein
VLKKRNRWLISSVLAIAVISFLGVMVVLPFAGALQGSRTANTDSISPLPGSEMSEDQRSDLEAQVRGYQLVLEREPGNQIALRGLLEAQLQLGDIEGAIDPLKKLVELNPTQTDFAVLLAQAQQEVGDREGAAQTYRNVLSTRPGDLQALQGLVLLLMQEQRPEAAIGLLQDTLAMANDANEVQPGSVDVVSVQMLLGQVYAESGRVNEAIAIYDEAAQRDEQDFRPILAKAIVLQATDRNDEAQPLFAKAESMAPAEFKDQIQQIAAGQTAPAATAPEADFEAEPSIDPVPAEDAVNPESSEAGAE